MVVVGVAGRGEGKGEEERRGWWWWWWWWWWGLRGGGGEGVCELRGRKGEEEGRGEVGCAGSGRWTEFAKIVKTSLRDRLRTSQPRVERSVCEDEYL